MKRSQRNTAYSAIFALLLSLLVIFPHSAQATPASNSSTNLGDSVCDFVPGVSDGVQRVVANSGTEENPIGLFSPGDIEELAYCVNRSSGWTSFSGVVFALGNDIDLTSQTLTPIGIRVSSRDTFFAGTLDGQGFEISGISISNSTTYSGFFGYLNGAEIKNLVLKGEVQGHATATGLLAGYVRSGRISNVTAYSSTSLAVITDNAQQGQVGGLIGVSRAGTSASNCELNDIVVEKVRVFPLSGTGIVKGFGSNQQSGAGGVIGQAMCTTLRDSRSSIGVDWGRNGTAGGLIGLLVGKVRVLGSLSTAVITTSTSTLVTKPNANMQDDVNVFSQGISSGGVFGRSGGIDNLVSNTHFSGQIHGSHGFHGGVAGIIESTNVLDSGSIGDMEIDGTGFVGGAFGYMYGSQTVTRVYASGFVEAISSSHVGGFAGAAYGSVASGTKISESYSRARLSVSSSVANSRAAGFIASVQGTEVKDSFTLGVLTLSATVNKGFVAYDKSSNAKSGNYRPQGLDDSTGWSTELSLSSFSELATFPVFDIGDYDSNQSGSTWLMCSDGPVHRASRFQETCPPFPIWGEIDLDGESALLIFDGLPSNQSAADFQLDSGNQASTATISGNDSIAFSLSSLVPGAGIETMAHSHNSSPPDRVKVLRVSDQSPQDLPDFSGVRMVNLSVVPGPAATLSSPVPTPTSIGINLSCGGSCGSADGYTYVASITPAGGSSSTISGAASSAITTLNFTGLSPNVEHTIRASVTFNGQTSATASTSVTTPKPIATISALTVADTSATLTVGCTNCGAPPTSFTVSATPVAGGAAITSNTNVISGLTSETTYSFSVVISFAGTTSDSVNWQDNPVMTLPFLPIISAVSPAALPLTGGTVTVTGANFTTSTEVTFGGATLSFTIVSGTEITFTASPRTAGSFDLSIQNQVGPFTLPNAITYVSGPSLSAIAPVLATTNGGTIVTLTGTDLATTTQVNVGSTTVSFSVVSNTSVRFVTAATSAGIVDVGVVTVGGSVTEPNGLEFTDSALVPVVSSITPATGPIAGGTTVTITGQFFSGSYSDSVSAAINGVSGSSLVLIDDSTLTFVTPAGSGGAFDLTVVTGGGLGTLPAAFTYTAPPPPATTGGGAAVVLTTPEITNFSTRELPTSGGEVRAEGRRLSGITDLTLGGIAVTIVTNTDTLVVFMVGAVPEGIWDLRLVADNGTLTFQQAITIVGQEVVLESTPGTMLGFTMTLRFTGNNRTLNVVQERNLTDRLDRFSTAETIICWGYTTAANPNAWAIAHATARAKAACDLAIGGESALKSVVRLRYGVSKDFAMRAALQFWR